MSADGAEPGRVMAQEIERKWLILEPPAELEQCEHALIEQGYLASDPRGVQVRVRRRAGSCFLTVKRGYGIARGEHEIALAETDFEMLWPLTEGRRLEKVRYKIPHGRYLIELDRYLGPLEGLYTAEVEFQSLEEATAFEPLNWFGKDISENGKYSNQKLAENGKLPADFFAR